MFKPDSGVITAIRIFRDSWGHHVVGRKSVAVFRQAPCGNGNISGKTYTQKN
ncbi:hypothetical protein [uncultured Bartonella sp.]|uniref:hypothetical protein n=1 Tax=uncultured Bartonella sp. TaxID=104108 RepID=UPI0026314FCD|nr:hypothetical protein [uncultured Bartonella sp.]